MTPNVPRMVMCNMENVVIPRPPALPLGPLVPSLGPLPLKPHTQKQFQQKSSLNASVRSRNSTGSQGFRLLENQDDTGSVYSIYKQKIDSMFESDSSSTKNSVQAKIEKMFHDVAIDNGIPLNDIGVHSFSVDYLGSIPLQEKVTSLSGLQNPLRELYFAYKKITKHKKPLTGRLEISNSGLKVQYQGEKGDLEQLNSFPTIAVWSAVKFVIHNNPKASYAFLPLITDPDNIDKQSLFRSLDENERKYITKEAHSPLFAVVMRKIGVHKQLECHGFVCQTSEDAIVIAATLYKSLVAHMKAKEKKPKNKNGVTCMSIASTFNDKGSNLMPVRPPRKKRSTTSSIISESDGLNTSDTQPLLSSPSKTPKKSIKTRRAPKAPEPKQDLDAIVPYEEPTQLLQNDDLQKIIDIKPKTFSDKISTYMSREQKQITAEIKQVMSESTNKGLKRVQSVRKRNDDSIRKKEHTGDILTKVTIPRSGSFLNAGGLTRYKSKVSRNNEQATGGSPLGFKEIFHELSLQEGLHSMDDILGVIIDPDGMSFNDLKPIYKEFLLKLSVTLTKDELYQRSKSIMRRQKKKLLRRNSSITTTKKNHHVLVTRKFKRLKHIFQKNLKMKLKRNSKSLPDKIKNLDIPNPIDSKLPESSISTSSYDTRQFRPKEEAPINRKQSYRKKSSEITRNRRDRTSTSEESDFFSLRRNKTKTQNLTLNNQNRNSSSGYVSCSECSYDSDTCTCVSADKCYCSLGHKNFNKKQRCSSTVCKVDEKCFCSKENTLTFCGCDTDSCTESNKCYCPTAPKNSTILEQLKQRGFIQSAESVTSNRHKKVCKNNSNTKSTRSLEYMHNPSETYYEKLKSKARGTTKHLGGEGKPKRSYSSTDNLAVDYELFTITNGDIRNLHNRSMYARSIAESAPPIGMHHKESSIRSYSSSRYGSKTGGGRTVQSTAISSGACTEALSVKKSAEIAALFADIKLSQTTDITHLAPRNYDLESLISSRNAYNKLAQHQSKFNKPNLNIKTINQYSSQRIVQNSLYSTRNGPPTKNGMYSAENGLYTIQSQSDESRRSSVSEGRRNNRDYFELDHNFNGRHKKNVSSSLENSLGYLP